MLNHVYLLVNIPKTMEHGGTPRENADVSGVRAVYPFNYVKTAIENGHRNSEFYQ